MPTDRDTPPAAGQVWMQGDKQLRIKSITETGRVVIETGGYKSGASWSDDPETWRARVRGRKLFLIEEGKNA